MKRLKAAAANILTVLFTVSAFLIAGFIAIIVPATSNTFYKTQFAKHGTLEKVRAQAEYLNDEKAAEYVGNLTEEQLLSLMNHTMRYCLYLEDDLNITVDGAKLEIFLDERGETLNSGCLERTHMADVKKLFGGGMIMVACAAINFDKAFTVFHEIFFSGKQWQFGYGVMIAMIGEIFTGIVPVIAGIWIVLLIPLIVSVALYNKKLSGLPA